MAATMTSVELGSQEPEQQRSESSTQESFGPNAEDAIVRAKQKWNDPPINKWRLLASFVSFAVVGASDGVYGVSFFSSNSLSFYMCARIMVIYDNELIHFIGIGSIRMRLHLKCHLSLFRKF